MSKASPSGSVRLFWAFVFALIGLCALSWWLLMPSGFAVAHPRFWSNGVLPLIWIAIAALGFYASIGAPALLQWLAVAPPAGLLSALLAMRLLHPFTAAGLLWWVPAAFAVALGALALATARANSPPKWQLLPGLAFIGFGAWLPLSLRAPPASTQPLGRAMPSDGLEASTDGIVIYQQGRMRLALDPLLRFQSRSPDGAWTLFAPSIDADTAPTPPCTLLSGPVDSGEAIRVEAQCALGAPVFSHLNSYASLRVSGHKRLSIAFSPTARTQFEVVPADYPEGQPMRFAYLDANDVFSVVEATSAEKGPFRQLGRGPLGRGDPLTLTLLDEGEARLQIVFVDWSAQLSAEASPSAGWGVPQNAVTFRRLGVDDNSPCEIELTLAATGIGRGFDSVAHAAGVYRNRVHLGPSDW